MTGRSQQPEPVPGIIDLPEKVSDLSRAGAAEATIASVLCHLQAAVGAEHGGALLLGPGNAIETATGSDDIVERADAIQADLGEGPDLTLLDGRESLLVPDTLSEARWPRWAEAVAALGLRSLISVRLSTRDRVLGSVNLYSRRPRAFADGDRELAESLARRAAVTVSASLTARDLPAAMDSHVLMGQAQGIVMERFDLTSDEAFAVLLQHSQRTDTKLRSVAQQVVDGYPIPVEPA
ncbi:GAF and ANTAR domain-containing protein [Aeromicrobium choanae]|uniref:GAF domain-containing protein n=1 Tax=Aeromicrobium choanae TaxID=1736691 RepID=A0A1T4Z558_9ACTN|nr:GAF and ANTAR domain-containing protein [Aeromicrobium choanae]SKB09076.1 GAF domain-containing protein [Aeromicrobium choanae]